MSPTPIRVAVIGDVHAHMPRLRVVVDHLRAMHTTPNQPGFTAVLLVGDLSAPDPGTPTTYAQYLMNAAKVFRLVNEIGAPVLYVPGNHDLPDLAARVGEVPALSVDNDTCVLPGVNTPRSLRIAGVGGSPDKFGFPYERTEEQLQRVMQHLASRKPDIWLMHCPPWGSRDRAAHGEHCGSQAIRLVLSNVNKDTTPARFAVCGHIHEDCGAVLLGDVFVYNAGALGAPYGAAQCGVLTLTDDPLHDSAEHYNLDTGETVRRTRQALALVRPT